MTRYRPEITAAAKVHGLDPLLVEAIVLTESSGNTDAFRFEPNFYNRYLKPYKLYVGQNPRRVSSSYGLMQIMLPVAHERGFLKSQPPEYLFVPEVGLEWGCKHLRFLIDWANDGWPDVPEDLRLRAAVAAYNTGRGGSIPGTSLRGEGYARKVFTQLEALKRDSAGSTT